MRAAGPAVFFGPWLRFECVPSPVTLVASAMAQLRPRLDLDLADQARLAELTRPGEDRDTAITRLVRSRCQLGKSLPRTIGHLRCS